MNVVGIFRVRVNFFRGSNGAPSLEGQGSGRGNVTAEREFSCQSEIRNYAILEYAYNDYYNERIFAFRHYTNAKERERETEKELILPGKNLVRNFSRHYLLALIFFFLLQFLHPCRSFQL